MPYCRTIRITTENGALTMARMFNPPHPGLTLRDEILPALGLTVTQAARTVLPDMRGSASDTPRCSSGVQAHFHGEPEALQPRSRRRRCSERPDILAHKVSVHGLRTAQRFTGNAQRMQALPSPMALVQVSIRPARAGQGLISTRRYGAQWRQQAGRHRPVDPAP